MIIKHSQGCIDSICTNGQWKKLDKKDGLDTKEGGGKEDVGKEELPLKENEEAKPAQKGN